MRRYSVIRNYKKFKKEYKYFIVFIKYGKVYYTFDSDAKIMMYLFNNFKDSNSFIIDKDKFSDILHILLDNGVNVVLAGSKNTREYYSSKGNDYIKIRTISKRNYKSTLSSVTK